MSGNYATKTDFEGNHFLRLKSKLNAPMQLEGNRTHKATIFIGNMQQSKVEWFECRSRLITKEKEGICISK
jgi:hypothetical protein